MTATSENEQSEAKSQSPSIAKLATALAKVQGVIEKASKDKNNLFFKAKYATLTGVWDACREHLSAHEIAVIQCPSSDGSAKVSVETTLVHSSGEWIRSAITLTAMPLKPGAGITPQSIGSAMTYARRYALASMVGITPDEDDDGNAASGRAPRAAAPRAAAPKPKPAPKPNASQIKRLYTIATNSDWTHDHVHKMIENHGLKSTKDLTIAQYNDLVTLIERNPRTPAPKAPPDNPLPSPDAEPSEFEKFGEVNSPQVVQ